MSSLLRTFSGSVDSSMAELALSPHGSLITWGSRHSGDDTVNLVPGVHFSGISCLSRHGLVTSVGTTKFFCSHTKVCTTGIGHHHAVNITLATRNDIAWVNRQGEVEADNIWEPEHGEVVVGVPQLDGHFVGLKTCVCPHVAGFRGSSSCKVPLTCVCVLHK